MNGAVNGNNRVEAKLLSIVNSVDKDELEGILGAWEAWKEENVGALPDGGSEVQAIAAENKRARTEDILGNDEHMYDANKPATYGPSRTKPLGYPRGTLQVRGRGCLVLHERFHQSMSL